jgi:hypothetical protein
VEELRSREGALLEAKHQHDLDVQTFETEKKRLDVALESERTDRKTEEDRLVAEHVQEAEKAVVERQKAIEELKSKHVEDVDGLERERLAVVEQIHSSHAQETAKLRTANEQTLANIKLKHEGNVKKLEAKMKEMERWQRSCHKLEGELKVNSQTLRTVRNQLETSQSDLKSRLVQTDTKKRELRKTRQELDDAKLAVVDEQKKVKAAQKETLVARGCETRLSNLLKDERRAWERERIQASDDIRKHAADLKKMQTDLQVSQKDAAPVESTVRSLEIHKVVADGVSSCLQTEIQQLRCESTAKTLENDETQNVVKELRSQLHHQEMARAEERKRAEEIKQSAKKHFSGRVCAAYDEGLGEDTSSFNMWRESCAVTYRRHHDL